MRRGSAPGEASCFRPAFLVLTDQSDPGSRVHLCGAFQARPYSAGLVVVLATWVGSYAVCQARPIRQRCQARDRCLPPVYVPLGCQSIAAWESLSETLLLLTVRAVCFPPGRSTERARVLSNSNGSNWGVVLWSRHDQDKGGHSLGLHGTMRRYVQPTIAVRSVGSWRHHRWAAQLLARFCLCGVTESALTVEGPMGTFQEFLAKSEKTEVIRFFTEIVDLLKSRGIGTWLGRPLSAVVLSTLYTCHDIAIGALYGQRVGRRCFHVSIHDVI